MVVLGFNFKRRRNLALGIALSGVGAGICAFAPLMQMAKDFYGYSGFFICRAAMQINLVTFGMLCFPSRLENYSQTMRLRDSGRLHQDTNVFKRRVMPYVNVMFNKGIVCLCLSMFLFCAASLLLLLHLPTYITSKGFSENQAAFLISLSGVFTIVGRLLTGVVANISYMNEIIIYACSMVIMSVATIVYPFVSRHFVGHVMFIIFMGLFLGSSYVVLTTVALKFVGINYIATAIGLIFMIGGVGEITGPVIAGILVDSGGTYDQSIIVAGVFLLMAAVCDSFSICFVAKRTDVKTISVKAPDDKNT
ncbi:MOT12-like protein [Mya arenaria]|uniref:MOT12-like protein n=2 Tax=Mya arenaria TaxID=6604 RepID=A0ABY7FKF7_MYAAR|nr:MOT12-like protein [Mya arenaria]